MRSSSSPTRRDAVHRNTLNPPFPQRRKNIQVWKITPLGMGSGGPRSTSVSGDSGGSSAISLIRIVSAICAERYCRQCGSVSYVFWPSNRHYFWSMDRRKQNRWKPYCQLNCLSAMGQSWTVSPISTVRNQGIRGGPHILVLVGGKCNGLFVIGDTIVLGVT